MERGHGGKIGVTSPGDLGCGSTFYFVAYLPSVPRETLPVLDRFSSRLLLLEPDEDILMPQHTQHTQHTQLPHPHQHQHRHQQQQQQQLAGGPVDRHAAVQLRPATDVFAHVLIVDDSALTRRLVGRTLDSIGATYNQCENGKQAVDQVALGNSYCVILMDKEMV